MRGAGPLDIWICSPRFSAGGKGGDRQEEVSGCFCLGLMGRRTPCHEPKDSKSHISQSRSNSGHSDLEDLISYATPIGAFFGPEIRAFTGFGVRFLQPFPKSLVTVKYYSNTKMAVNAR